MQGGPADVTGLGYERLVPSALLPPEDPTGTRPLTTRDRLVDLAAIVASVLFGVLALVTFTDTALEPLSTPETVVDVAAGVVAVGALLFRRRAPVVVGLLTSVLTAVSVTAGVPAAIALFTVAVHRRAQLIVPVIILHVVASNVYSALRPSELPWLIQNLVALAVPAIVVGFGMFVRARRQLVWTLRERAQRAETEQELLAEQARLAERARIAREMHDVLGHRISLITLQAGGLEVRPDLPPEEVAAIAATLRSTARQALDELRAVIGVLREDGTVDTPSAPQPTLTDIGRLVEDSRRAGATVSLSIAVDDPAAAPESMGRIAYRVVQEALTNVTKHAPGAATLVEVSGGPGDGLVVEVRNQTTTSTTSSGSASGSGVGLIGLRERVELADGALEHGTTGHGDFVVTARLRWE